MNYCRAIAAAVLGDPAKVRYVPTTTPARFTVLQSGEIDLLVRDSTLTMTRSLQLHLAEVAINFYAGQGFLVSKKLGVSKIEELDGATICTLTGATLELNIADFARARGTKIGTLLFEKSDEAIAAMEAGRCDGYTRRHRQPGRRALDAEDAGRLGGAGGSHQQGAARHPCPRLGHQLGQHPVLGRYRAEDRRGTRGDQGQRR